MSENIAIEKGYGRTALLPRADALGKLDAGPDYAIRRSASPQKYMTIYSQTSPHAQQEAKGLSPSLAQFYNDSASIHGYLVELTLEGRGLVDYAGERFVAQPGSVYFLDCSRDYYLRTDPDVERWLKLYAYLSGPCISTYYTAFRAASGGKSRCLTSVEGPCSDLFEHLISLYNSNEITRFQEVKASTAICNLLLACVEAASDQAANTRIPGVVRDMQVYLSEHYAERITLDHLSKVFAMDKCHLQKLFKRYNGLTPNEFLIATRIRQAKRLLLESQFSIAEVGYAVGMENTSYFIKQFHRSVGKTPAHFRRLANDEESVKML